MFLKYKIKIYKKYYFLLKASLLKLSFDIFEKLNIFLFLSKIDTVLLSIGVLAIELGLINFNKLSSSSKS